MTEIIFVSMNAQVMLLIGATAARGSKSGRRELTWGARAGAACSHGAPAYAGDEAPEEEGHQGCSVDPQGRG